MIVRQLLIFVVTYWVTSDVLCLLTLRFLRPVDRDSGREIFLLTRGLGPIAVSWLLFHLLLVFPHHLPFLYVAVIAAVFVLAVVAGRTQLATLRDIYVDLFRALPSCWPQTTSGRLLLAVAAGLVMFVFFIGIGFPIVEGDALGFTTEARLIYRDLSFEHYPTFSADPQTGYYYLTFQTPSLQSLYVWFFVLTRTRDLDLLLRTVSPMYALYCALLVFWLLWQRSRKLETALWGVIALFAIPVFTVHSYLNTQDPHRIYLCFCALLCLTRFLRRPSAAGAAFLGVFVGLAVYAHLLGMIVAGIAATACLLSRGRFQHRLATVVLVAVVAVPLSGMHYYLVARQSQTKTSSVAGSKAVGDGAASDRVARRLAIGTTGRSNPDPVDEWLMTRRGQGSAFARTLFGYLLPLTGIEWFGFSFWLFALALVSWMRQPGKTTIEIVMAWTAAVYLIAVLSGLGTLAWSNPRYTGTLAPVVAYFVGAWAARCSTDHRWSTAALMGVLLTPLLATTAVRGAKVGITNPGDFFDKLHSTVWIRTTMTDPQGSLRTLWENYFGVRQTLRYAWASQQEKLLHAHDYFRAVDYMNCCTPANATGLVIGRETYYFYYSRRRGASLVAPQLEAFRTMKEPRQGCDWLDSHGIDYALVDSYYTSNPWYVRTTLGKILGDPNLSTLVFEAGTARVYRLSCGPFASQAGGRRSAGPQQETDARATLSDPPRTGYYNGNNAGGNYQIGRVDLSPDGRTWVRHPRNPVLSTGRTWLEYGVFHPFPLQVGGTVYLYYIASRFLSGREVMLATSTDGGVTFTESESNPVLRAGVNSDWDAGGLWFPFVMFDAEEADPAKRWKMWFAGDLGGYEQIGYACSADGIIWTKYSGNPIVSPGPSGTWDDGLSEAPVVVKDGGVWYLYYGGCKADNGAGHQCQVGLTVAQAPQGPYAKVNGGTGGPVLARRHLASQALTVDAVLESRILRVPDSSVFELQEPVMLGDDDTYPLMSRVASIDSPTQVALRDAVVADVTVAARAALRSVFSQSVDPSFVYRDGDKWRMIVTGFQEFNDKGYLTEQSGYATASRPQGPWSFDMHQGILLEPTPGTWDYRSIENLRLLYTAAPTASPRPTPTPGASFQEPPLS